MKINILIPFLIYSSLVLCQADSLIIKGRVTNSFTQEPIENIEVIFSKKYGSQLSTTKTDRNGNFEFNDLKSELIQITVSDSSTLRSLYYTRNAVSLLDLEIKLRPKNHNLAQKEIDSTLIGSKIKHILNKNSLYISDIHEINEPPGISRGFYFELGDSTIVYIFIERTSHRYNERKWMNKKVIGVGIARIDGTKHYYGDGQPNPN